MNAQSPVAAPLAKLREPFAKHQISKLPKPYKRDSAKGNCAECGGYHGLPAMHLDYVGHAALTDRLLDTDPGWSWEPAGFTAEGLPAHDKTGGLWIKLTVCGVTRYGYGAADGKQGGDAVKEIIGDALRNAAMRFGAALDLWHKGDLHVEGDDSHTGPTGEELATKRAEHRDDPFPQGPAKNKTSLKEMGRELWKDVEACGDEDELVALIASSKPLIDQLKVGLPTWWDGGSDAKGEPFEGLAHVIDRNLADMRALANVRTPIDAG